MEYKKIDVETWERKSHFRWFSSFADPTAAVNVKTDVTGVLEYCRRNNVSSFAVIMYVICECMNAEKAFRYRILGGEPVEIPYANVGYTVLVNDSYFVNCHARTHSGFETYLSDVKGNKEKFVNNGCVQQTFNDVAVINDIYCSCVPWIAFESVTQPIPDKDAENRAIPRACWCKYYTENGRTFTTLNITADHSLVDGYDISKVFIAIQKAFDNIEDFLEAE